MYVIHFTTLMALHPPPLPPPVEIPGIEMSLVTSDTRFSLKSVQEYVTKMDIASVSRIDNLFIIVIYILNYDLKVQVHTKCKLARREIVSSSINTGC